MIEVRHLAKRYGPVVAVDGLTFDVLPGRVTGFLGPNGAGKSTTMRLILGLDAPTGGTATVAGRPYRALRRPLLLVGTMLEAAAVHPGRSARGHLLALRPRTRFPAAGSMRCSAWRAWRPWRESAQGGSPSA
jgi:ABC-2 type transport system ATP-binding protein